MKKKEIGAVLKQLDQLPLPEKEEILSVCRRSETDRQTEEKEEWNIVMRRRLNPAAVCAAFVLLAVLLSAYAISVQYYGFSIAALFVGDGETVSKDLVMTQVFYQDDLTEGNKTISTYSIPGISFYQAEPDDRDREEAITALDQQPDADKNETAGITDSNGNVYQLGVRKTENGGQLNTLKKYKADKLLWEVPLDLYGVTFGIVENYIYLYGNELGSMHILLYNDLGEKLWEKTLDSISRIGFVQAKDGILCAENCYSRDGKSYYSRYRIDIGGTILDETTVALPDNMLLNSFVREVEIETDSGFLFRLLGSEDIAAGSKRGQLASIDAEGKQIRVWAYTASDGKYFFQDAALYHGKLYISGYISARAEYSEKINRKDYKALLLVLDPATGVPQNYYEAAGSLGGTIVSDPDGNLTWEVKSILELKKENPDYREGVSIYQYTLDENGELLKQKEMGIYEGFYE